MQAERKLSHYEKITQWLVSSFQKNHKIEDTGTVDEATATTLNETLLKLGLVDSFDNDRKWTERDGVCYPVSNV